MSNALQDGGSRRVLSSAAGDGCRFQRPACVDERLFEGVSTGWCAACCSTIEAPSEGADLLPARVEAVVALLPLAADDGCDGFGGSEGAITLGNID